MTTTTQHEARRPIGTGPLLVAYLVTGCVAAFVGVLTSGVGLLVASALRIGCRPVTGGDVLPGGELDCPDGTAKAIPALVLAGLGCAAVLAAAATLVSRRADAPTLERISRHALWLALAIVAIPGLAWVGVVHAAPTAQPARWAVPFEAFAAIAFAAIPLVVSYVRPVHTRGVLTACLVVPVAAVLAGWWLPLVLPVVLPLAVVWSILLWLSRAARRAREHASAQATEPHPDGAAPS